MSYVIGIGALIEGHGFNRLRASELEIAQITDNWQGLGQPPHVTVKRPFTVDSLEDIATAKNIMDRVTKQAEPFTLRLNQPNCFGTKVIYIEAESKALQELHIAFLELLQPLYTTADKLEGENMVFHSTLAMNLTETEHMKAGGRPKGFQPITCDVTKLGLFLGIDNLTHWVVIAESVLGS